MLAIEIYEVSQRTTRPRVEFALRGSPTLNKLVYAGFKEAHALALDALTDTMRKAVENTATASVLYGQIHARASAHKPVVDLAMFRSRDVPQISENEDALIDASNLDALSAVLACWESAVGGVA